MELLKSFQLLKLSVRFLPYGTVAIAVCILISGCTMIPAVDKADENEVIKITADKSPPAKRGIRKVISSHMSEIVSCYEDALDSNPDLFGKVVISFDLGETGKVTDSSIVSSEIPNAKFNNCLTSRIKSWVFPPQAKNKVTTVRYPFFFSN